MRPLKVTQPPGDHKSFLLGLSSFHWVLDARYLTRTHEDYSETPAHDGSHVPVGGVCLSSLTSRH
jgi:hypothetical protein